ncbi:MAG: DUF429 domain-containing protein [Gemmatimonadota bacterium]
MYVGVDGCRIGWCAMALSPQGDASVEVYPTFTALWDAWRAAQLILVDIPIGLKDDDPRERRCDLEARKVLGYPRGSSVFPAPSRRSLDAESYAEASELNRSSTGRGLSRQSWAIVPKIREVDRLLRNGAGARSSIREVHPEVLFWALSGGSPILTRKKKPAGILERLQVLESVYPGAEAVYSSALRRWKRSEVARDDLVDALAAAVTGWIGGDRLQSLPGVQEADPRGLPMEMVYAMPG